MDDRGYVEYLLRCIDFLLERLKKRRERKILGFYRGRLEAWLQSGEKQFTEPLVADYILRGMTLCK